tara:strand:- start:690876 stop:691139 length:264 start_codon:yes stop_codon:yes gene_type:complete
MNESNEAKTKPETKAWYLRPKSIIAAIAAVVFLILIFQNWDSVSVRILFWTQSVPASLMYVFFAIAGFIAARITHKTRPRATGSVSK